MADFVTSMGQNASPVWEYDTHNTYPTLRLRHTDFSFTDVIAILFDQMPTIQLEAIVNARNGSLLCGELARSPEPWEHMTQLIEQTIEAAQEF